MKKLIINASKCWGCRTCEKTCSKTFRNKSRLGKSRINVVAKNKNERIPITCLQCIDAACVISCEFGALERNKNTGSIEINYNKCTHCFACLAACPFGNIILDASSGDIVKCNLCNGDAECAKTCPSGTLIFGETI